MSSRAAQFLGLALLTTFAGVEPTSTLAAELADLPALERAWHSCVRQAYDSQQDHGSRAGRERNALDECKPHEDAYVAALMAARPGDADASVSGWARTWAAYVSFVVDPVKAWIEALRR
jgi:phosphotransacetylase